MLSSTAPLSSIGNQSKTKAKTKEMQQQTGALSSTGGAFGYGERPQLGLDVEFGADPASGAFFQTDGRKHDDLKQMLDSNKDGLKLEAMKRIIGMVARGRDASELFPAVVKNVVSKNIEVKKLVYVYLVRYAEEQQDLALLSISTFQRALKDPNQLIRASALRVLSSIRVSMIVPIVMLAIRDSATDMSPYVRKTAAHAIPKLYSLDADQKDELVTVIEKLLADRTTLVVGSAVMAFDEVCPERVDLVHRNYRKLCNLLVDIDEWGQVIILNMLTRYARTQFADPNADAPADHDTPHRENFYDESSGGSTDSDAPQQRATTATAAVTPTCHVDLDHRSLLRQAKPLLQSRNASVVMAVAQLYHHLAPRSEVPLVAKALVRLLRSHKEVQSVVLTCIASMSSKRRSLFEPQLKSFFVRPSDPTHIKLLKLDILTSLASAASISLVLREFQTYISSNDRAFVAATVQAIGRCAASIPEVTDTCLGGLVQLLSNRDEHVVAEAVVVIKKLLQTQAAEQREIIAQMARLLDFIAVPAARAAILWLIGEYNEKVPQMAPDVLRKMAKSFVDEEDVVKLQVLNLGVKLYLTNAPQTSLLCQYVFTLARYDPNYDVRDRARFLRQFVFPASGKPTVLSENARRVFLAAKPAPALEGKYRDRDHLQLGSLSHYLNVRAAGYADLPPFPAVPPDASVRNVEGIGGAEASKQNHSPHKANKKAPHEQSFFSASEKSSEYSETESSSDSSSSSESDGEEEAAAAEPKASDEPKTTEAPAAEKNGGGSGSSESASWSSTESDSGSSGSDSDTLSEGDTQRRFEQALAKAEAPPPAPENAARAKLDLLLDLDDIPPVGPIMTPSLGGFLTPGTPMTSLVPQSAADRIELVAASHVEFKHSQLLNKLAAHGLQIGYRFTRSPHLYSAAMASIELQFVNQTDDAIEGIRMGEHSTLTGGQRIHDFAPIASLRPQEAASSVLGVDFNDSTHAIEFDLVSEAGVARASLKPPIGELLRSVQITDAYFRAQRTQLRGMNEHQSTVSLAGGGPADLSSLRKRVFECLNVAQVPSAEGAEESLHFVGQTLSSKSLVLVSLEWGGGADALTLTVNCEKMVVGSMVLSELRKALAAVLKG